MRIFKFLLCTLMLPVLIAPAHAETKSDEHESIMDPKPAPDTALGSVETAQHKAADETLDATYLQTLQASSHSGIYGVGFWGLGLHRARLAYQNYKSYSAQYGALVGYGRTLENKRYIGAEFVYTRDLFDQRKGVNRFRRSNAYELAGRYGKIIQANFLPYMRLGFGYQDYQYFAGTQKNNFHGILLTPGIGVQTFVRPHIFIRVETSYQWAVRAKHKNVIVNRKPQGPNLWGGVGVVF